MYYTVRTTAIFIENCVKIKELLNTIEDETLAPRVQIDIERQNSEDLVQELEGINDNFYRR